MFFKVATGQISFDEENADCSNNGSLGVFGECGGNIMPEFRAMAAKAAKGGPTNKAGGPANSGPPALQERSNQGRITVSIT
jgi:hypothetical protein